MGSSGGSSSSSFTDRQEHVLQQFLDSERQRIGAGENIFQGDRFAPFSELQQQAVDFAPDALFRTPEQEQQLFQQGIRDPALREFQQTTIPNISESFAGPGFFGSARAQEQVRAGEDLAFGLSQARSGLRQETEAINRAGVSNLFNIGAQQQQQEQNLINQEIQRFAEENRLTSAEDTAILLSLLNANFTTSSSGGGGGLGSAIGAAIGFIGGGPAGAAAGASVGGAASSAV